MPVTKTAERALRSSQRKRKVNLSIERNLQIAIKKAKKSKSKESIRKAISLADKAAKKKFIHPNKSARIKSSLSKLAPKTFKSKKGGK